MTLLFTTVDTDAEFKTCLQAGLFLGVLRGR